MVIPLTLLNQIDQRRCEWLVPGLATEKTQLYLKSLPQKLRRYCVPLPDYAKKFVERTSEKNTFGDGDYLDALIADMREQTQVQVQREDFRPENLPLHCFMNFRLVDEYGRQIDLERNLGKLRAEHSQAAREVFQDVAASAVHQLVTPSNNNSSNVSTSAASGAKDSNTRAAIAQTDNIKFWSFGALPELLEIKRGKRNL